MPKGDFVNFGICWCCQEELPLDNSDTCETCANKLNKQKETGRCSWCGRLVLDCDCDDDY